MGRLQNRFVFLAASYPSREYASTADSHEIARAVKALLGAVFHEHGKIVFGGHPSISPVVLMMAREFGEKDGVWIYQSELFRPLVVQASLDLKEEGYGIIKFIKAEPGESPEPGKCTASLKKMRESMIAETDPIAAVLIGGDSGLGEELVLFRRRYPHRPVFPIGGPGGKARELLLSGRGFLPKEFPRFWDQLGSSRNYIALMNQAVELITSNLDLQLGGQAVQ